MANMANPRSETPATNTVSLSMKVRMMMSTVEALSAAITTGRRPT